MQKVDEVINAKHLEQWKGLSKLVAIIIGEQDHMNCPL